jgi:putative transposase
MSDETHTPARVRWARLRFQIIGQLLAAPPEAGDLAPRIAELAARAWRHATNGEVVRFSPKTIERWYYAARDSQDPIRTLERKVPKHAGTHPSVSDAVVAEIRALRRDHPRWSYKLVHDNLVVIARENPALQPLPGYASVCRYMKHHGLGKRRKPRRHELEPTFVPREQRSYAVSHVHALWHFDFHVGQQRFHSERDDRTLATRRLATGGSAPWLPGSSAPARAAPPGSRRIPALSAARRARRSPSSSHSQQSTAAI